MLVKRAPVNLFEWFSHRGEMSVCLFLVIVKALYRIIFNNNLLFVIHFKTHL